MEGALKSIRRWHPLLALERLPAPAFARLLAPMGYSRVSTCTNLNFYAVAADANDARAAAAREWLSGGVPLGAPGLNGLLGDAAAPPPPAHSASSGRPYTQW